MRRSLTNLTKPLNGPYLAVWAVILALHALLGIMMIFNWFGWKLLIGVLGSISYLALLFLGVMPQVFVTSGVVGGAVQWLQDRDVSRGAVTGIITLYKALTAIVMAFLAGVITLMLFNFQFGGFIGVYLGTVLIFTTLSIWPLKPKWARRFMLSLGFAIIIGSLWQGFGPVYNGQAFEGGIPTAMVDTNTDNVYDVDPEDCLPRGEKDVLAYDFTKNEPGMKGVDPDCFSGITGEALIPIRAKDAIKRNPSSLLGSALKPIQNVAANTVAWANCKTDADAPGCAERATKKAAGAAVENNNGCFTGSWSNLGGRLYGHDAPFTVGSEEQTEDEVFDTLTADNPGCVCLYRSGQSTIIAPGGNKSGFRIQLRERPIPDRPDFTPLVDGLETENYVMYSISGKDSWVNGTPSPYDMIRIQADTAQYRKARVPHKACMIFDIWWAKG